MRSKPDAVFAPFRRWRPYILTIAVLITSPCAADDDAVEPPHDAVITAAFTPDGRNLVIARFDGGGIEVRAVPDGKLVATAQAPQGTNQIAVSPDGALLSATNSFHGVEELPLWDARTWKPLKAVRVAGKKLYGVAFSPASDLMAIGASENKRGAEDKTIVLWDIKKETVRVVLHGDTSCAAYLAFSPDAHVLTSAREGDRWVDLWYGPDEFARSNSRGVQGNSGGMRCLGFLPEGDAPPTAAFRGHAVWLATGGDDHAIRVFVCYGQQEIQTLKIP